MRALAVVLCILWLPAADGLPKRGTGKSEPGTARARLCDKGEPGENDIFQIQLSNGYFAGGDLGGNRPGGGNIQLHKCH